MKRILPSLLVVIFYISLVGCGAAIKTPRNADSPGPGVEVMDVKLHDIPDEITIDDIIVPMYLPQGKGKVGVRKQGRQATISVDEKAVYHDRLL